MKRSPVLRALSSEHHTALVLARHTLAVTGDEVDKAWEEVVQRFEVALEPHFLQEETLLLPALAQIGEADLVERTLSEHARLRALVHELEHDAENLRLFGELLHAHIRFEERELFATAQARLPEFSEDKSPTKIR